MVILRFDPPPWTAADGAAAGADEPGSEGLILGADPGKDGEIEGVDDPGKDGVIAGPEEPGNDGVMVGAGAGAEGALPAPGNCGDIFSCES